MTALDNALITARVTAHLALHPRDIARLRKWLRERHASPLETRRPWWPYDAITWVEAHLPPSAVVLEFGGGGSSLWLLDHGARLTVVENDADWARKLSAEGVEVVHAPRQEHGGVRSEMQPGFFDDYVAVADKYDNASLDLVAVDGGARVECVRRAAPKVKPGGMLLLDDTGRAAYKPAIRALGGWERHTFPGLKAGDIWPSQTSVWVRPTTGQLD